MGTVSSDTWREQHPNFSKHIVTRKLIQRGSLLSSCIQSEYLPDLCGRL